MLGRYGTVVTIPYKRGSSSVESMAGAINAAVEAKTGLPLDAFRRSLPELSAPAAGGSFAVLSQLAPAAMPPLPSSWCTLSTSILGGAERGVLHVAGAGHRLRV
ncbi:hypothetical protein ABBQ38_013585 [Trebouxia sp. C0009 RCD-2024]